MSKPAITQNKTTSNQQQAKNAWASGPPNANQIRQGQNGSRSQSPSAAPQSTGASNASTPAHSRKPSVTAPAVAMKDGVRAQRNSSINFGSIDNSTSPTNGQTETPQTHLPAKSFGSIPASAPTDSSTPTTTASTTPNATNSSASTPTIASSSVTASPTPSTASTATAPVAPKKAKFDMHQAFRGTTNPTVSTSAPTNTTPSAVASPQPRNSNLPQSHLSPYHPPSQPSHLRQSQGPQAPPRSPQLPRQIPNGNANVANGPPRVAPINTHTTGPSQIGSPRPGHQPPAHHQQSPLPSAQTPHQTMPMQAMHPGQGWGQYYNYFPGYNPTYPMDPAAAQYWSGTSPHQTLPHQPFMSPSHIPPHLAHHPHNQPSPIGMSPRNGPISVLPSTAPGTPPVTNASIASPIVPQPPRISTPLTAQAREFIPGGKKPSAPVRIVNPNTKEAVSFGEPQNHHSRTASREDIKKEIPPRKSVPVRLESEEDRKKRIAEQEAKQREEERKKQEAEEERIRKEKEEEERIRREKEEAERIQREKEEEEARRKKEEEEAKERERLRIEAEERAKREEEERLRKEAEEQERLEQERIRKEHEELERKKKEEEERLRREEERRQKEEEERLKKEAEEKARLEKELTAKKEAEAAAQIKATESPTSLPAGLPNKPALPPLTIEKHRARPGPLDLSGANKSGTPQPLPSALATARIIEDLDSISYPQGIKTPDVELNKGFTKGGKFKYDRDFLLQFMDLCKEKPENLSALDQLGIEKEEGGNSYGSQGRAQGRRGMSTSSQGPNRSASIGLGIGIGGGGRGVYPGTMGTFQPPITRHSTSEERFAASNRRDSGFITPSGRPLPMTRTNSSGGPGGVPQSPREGNSRTRSQRGRQRNDSLKPNTATGNASQFAAQAAASLEPVVPLEVSANRWVANLPSARGRGREVDQDSPEIVERKVKALLNKLTLEKFDSISDQIIQWANKSEKEKNGQTLIQVIKLVFEKATDEATWSEMYARLCRKMMETISPDVQDETIRSADGKPITGGLLFRKYLLNRCQEDFERGWSTKEAALAAAKAKAADDSAAAAVAKSGGEEVVLYSEEYYAALKAKRQGLGLVKFIGELFKLAMLTERIMHECIKKLLSNVENPEEEEIESLCKLLTTVGSLLDTNKAKGHMDIYFSRMKDLSKNPNVPSRLQYMLVDVIELRERGWQARNAVAAPQTIAQVHEAAAKEKAAQEKEAMARHMQPMTRGGSRRGQQDRGDYNQQSVDGWNVAGGSGSTRNPGKVGDISQFGKISKSGSMTMGPSSIFKKDKGGRETPPLSRTASSSNMFHMLGSGEVPADMPPTARTPSNRGSSRKASQDMSQAQAVPDTPMRRKLQLLPRTIGSVSADSPDEKEVSTPVESDEDSSARPVMSDEQAKSKVEEDVKEFFQVRDLAEAVNYFSELPDAHKARLVDKLASAAMEKKEDDVKLVAELFSRASGSTCPPSAFEEGFSGLIEFLDDMAIDVPQAYSMMARLLRGAKLSQDAIESLASKISVEGEPLVTPRDKLLKEYAKLA